jgi:hypothetical protein
MIEEEYINLETVKLAKEKGIFFTNEMVCDGSLVFNQRFIDVPSQSIFARWLREKHGLYICINCIAKESYFYAYINKIISCDYKFINEHFETYEDAMEAGLQEALKLIE